MSTRLKVQTAFFAVLLSSAVFGWSRVLFAPTASSQQVADFQFPDNVPLPGWQPADEPTAQPQPNSPTTLAKHVYQYRHSNQQLDIQMDYVTAAKGADVVLHRKTSIPVAEIATQSQGDSFYNLAANDQGVHLNACIVPNGNSTANEAQFRAATQPSDVSFDRYLLWLAGRDRLTDDRCLMTHLSIPLGQSTPEDVYPLLEAAWMDWHDWWRSRFPER